MSFEFKLPDIGEGVSEGEIVEWHVAVGDQVAEDDPMVEVMTDKATVTIGAPRAGTIADLRFGPGDVAQVGDVVVVIREAGDETSEAAAWTDADAVETSEAKRQLEESQSEGPAATAVGDIREGLPGTSFFQTPRTPSNPQQGARASGNGNGAAASTTGTGSEGGRRPPSRGADAQASSGRAQLQVDFFQAKPLATPATRKLARDLGLDLRRVPPSGPGGRTTRDDVKGYAGGASTGTKVRAPEAWRRDPQPIEAGTGEPVERKPFVGIRRKIAQRMQLTKNTAAHFTFVEECDCTALMSLRERLKPAAAEAGVSLSYLPFIVKAVVAALKKHPVLNSALDEAANELVYRKYFHMGIAAATPAGLMVPVVRHADRRSILDLAREIERLGEGARAGSLTADELTGSTFTITSLGRQGGLFATPVLNHPEVGILGVHRIKEKPVVRDGSITIGQVMLLSLSFDHRIVDGHIGAAFAYDIIEALEQPERLFLDMV